MVECGLELGINPCLIDQITAHINDGSDVIDHHRAFSHTRATGRACPQDLVAHDLAGESRFLGAIAIGAHDRQLGGNRQHDLLG